MVSLLVLVVLFASVESRPLFHDQVVEFQALCPPNDDIQTMKHNDIQMMNAKPKKNDQQQQNTKLKDNVHDMINFEDAKFIKKQMQPSEINKDQSDAFRNYGEMFKNVKRGRSCDTKLVCRRISGKKRCFPKFVCTSSGSQAGRKPKASE